MKMKKYLSILLAALLIFSLAACGNVQQAAQSMLPDVLDAAAMYVLGSGSDAASSEQTELPDISVIAEQQTLDPDGTYTSRDEVALYIYEYGHLPQNFITKNEAKNLGWSGGSLEPYAPGMCIGGSHFGNYEGILPEKAGRSYTECDIDTLGADNRGAKRIVFSNDGLIYYTEDHYESFTLLYGEE